MANFVRTDEGVRSTATFVGNVSHVIDWLQHEAIGRQFLSVLCASVFPSFHFRLRERPEKFVEVCGDQFGEREEPDVWFVLPTVLAVAFLEDVYRRSGRANEQDI